MSRLRGRVVWMSVLLCCLKGKARQKNGWIRCWKENWTTTDWICLSHGREDKTGSKRSATTNQKFFAPPFKRGNIVAHHKDQHPCAWEEYSGLSAADKDA